MLLGMDELIILSSILLSGVGLAWRLESLAIGRDEDDDISLTDLYSS